MDLSQGGVRIDAKMNAWRWRLCWRRATGENATWLGACTATEDVAFQSNAQLVLVAEAAVRFNGKKGKGGIMMKECVLSVSLISLSAISLAAPLSSADWNEVNESTKKACLERQSNAPENANMTVGQINEFCTCASERTANSLSAESAEYIKNTGDGSAMIRATTASYGWCAQTLFKKWGY